MDDYKPIEINDRNVFAEFLSADPPVTSELTFTNLFMWRQRYQPVWRVSEDCLVIVLQPEDDPPFGLRPVGKGNKEAALDLLCAEIRKMSPEGRICRAAGNFVQDHVDREKYFVEEDRDNSDYVYLTENLIKLPGKRYHSKKNHVNKFVKNHEFEFRAFDQDLVKGVLDLQETWCQLRECTLNPGLYQENIAIHEAISHFTDLGFKGGAILIDSKVEAFSFGEMLDPDTVVIHIEKANPAIPGLYAAINQIFCENTWSEVKYVNREQDLGVEGLRKAKLSYHPDHMVDKFTIIPK